MAEPKKFMVKFEADAPIMFESGIYYGQSEDDVIEAIKSDFGTDSYVKSITEMKSKKKLKKVI
jgi:hypothetical protein